jgi:hypothetical protein
MKNQRRREVKNELGEFIAGTSIMPLADLASARRAPVN